MKKLTFLLMLLVSLNTLFAQCDDPNLWFHDYSSTSTRTLNTYNLTTATKTQICGAFRPSTNTTAYPQNDYYDIAFDPSGNLYGLAYYGYIPSSASLYYQPQVVGIPTAGCGINYLGQIGSIDFYTYSPNSFTFLPDGSALVGYSTDLRNGNTNHTTTKIQRVRFNAARTQYWLEDWHTLSVPAGQSIVAGGDFILLGDKLYVAMVINGNTNVIYEMRVNSDYNYLSTVNTYSYPVAGNGTMQGMAAVNGILYGGFSDGSIRRLNFAGTAVNLTNIASGVNVFGMTARGEADQQTNPVITAPGTNICINTNSSLQLTATSGGSPVSYQWYKDGVSISGATGETYTVAPGAVNAGSYTVVVNYGANCFVTSAPYTVTEQCAVYRVSGRIWNDVNRDAVLDATESGTNLGTTPTDGLWINLIDGSGNITASVPIGADGTYGLETNVTGTYSVRVSNTGLANGTNISAAPATAFTLPAPYEHSGSNLGGTPNTGNTSGSVTVTLGTSGLSNVNFAVSDPTNLPVVFSYVSSSYSGSDLMVKWATASETHNDHFEIEASTDGKTFTKIGEAASKAANGNSSISIAYEFSVSTGTVGLAAGMGLLLLGGLGAGLSRRRRTLFAAMIVAGLALGAAGCAKSNADTIATNSNVFIRIAQVDKDGKKSYSDIVKAVKK